MVLEIGDEEDETPSFYDDHSLVQSTPSSTFDLDESTFGFYRERYIVTLIVLLLMSSLSSTAIGGDASHSIIKRVYLSRMDE
jgi:Mn2+/Fe2+ NRAMP family transporter